MAAALCLTGCGGSIELNEKQNAEAAEYLAGVLLKYSSNYDKSLIYPEDVSEPENSAEPTATPVGIEGTSEPASEEIGVGGIDAEKTDAEKTDAEKTDKMFTVSNVQFTCGGKKTCKEYTQKSAKSYAIYADEGKMLVVVDVKVKNVSSSDKKINLMNKGFEYQLLTSDGVSYKTQITAFNNDVNYLSAKVKAGKSKKCVAVFMVPKKTSLENCQLSISKGSSSATLEIK